MKRTFLITLIIIGAELGVFGQETPPADTENIRDSAIVYPESMTEKLSDLLRQWQIDLSDAQTECKRGQNVIFHDSVYLERLSDLPSEMELTFNSVVKKYIEMYAVRKREQVSYMLALGNYYFPMFEQALDRHGLPLELKYLPVIESALNPVAVSRQGATGLWQFMLRTGKGYGLEVNSLVDERRDPYKSTEAAVEYLKDLYAIYGDWNLVIAAYNCGPGNVNKAIARSGGKRDYWEIYYKLPKETRGYVPAFIAANYIMNFYSEHNICPVQVPSLSYAALDTVHVSERMHLEQIAGVLNITLNDLQRLNPQYKKNVVPGDSKVQALVLPTEKMLAFISKNDTILNYNKDRYFTHRANTDGYLNGTVTTVSGNRADIYYKVKKGDNLSTIARKHGTTVAMLKSWNGLSSNKLSIGKRLIVGKKEVASPANQELLAQATVNSSDGKTQVVNQYYRVRKGDTLDKIAKSNGTRVAQLQSWNGLRSSKIDIGDKLIVGQKVVPTPQEEADSGKNEYNRSESSSSGEGNIISSYLREQIEKVEQNQETENPEGVSETETVSIESEELEEPTSEKPVSEETATPDPAMP